MKKIIKQNSFLILVTKLTLSNLSLSVSYGEGVKEKKKIYWVAWQNVCREKDKGGLGLKDLRLFYTALLGKWLWRVRTEIRAMWVKVLTSKYGGVNGYLDVGCRIGSRWWLDIISLEGVDLGVRSLCFQIRLKE